MFRNFSLFSNFVTVNLGESPSHPVCSEFNRTLQSKDVCMHLDPVKYPPVLMTVVACYTIVGCTLHIGDIWIYFSYHLTFLSFLHASFYMALWRNFWLILIILSGEKLKLCFLCFHNT